MTRNSKHSAEFVEALARGLDVIKSFSPSRMELTVSEVAKISSLARPTARRLLITLEQLEYVRISAGKYSLTPKTLELGTAYIASQGMWDVAQPHLIELVEQTGESSSMSQLEGSDIVYTARVPVAKIISIAVHVGTKFPAVATSMGKVLLADLSGPEIDNVLKTRSNSGVVPRVKQTRKQLDAELLEIRRRGWALSDQLLSLGIRSIAAPIINSSGRTIAAVNVTVNAAETSIEKLKKHHLPRLLLTAAKITRDYAHLSLLPTNQPLTK